MRYRWVGFTLIEVLIVVFILALLAAVTSVTYNGIVNRASEATALSDLDNVGVALAAYKAKNGYYPGKGCVDGTESCPGASSGTGAGAKILDALAASPYDLHFSKDTYRDVTDVTPVRIFLAYTVDTSLPSADRTIADICVAVATSNGTYRYYTTQRGVLGYDEDNINIPNRQTKFGQSCADEGGMTGGTLTTQPVILTPYIEEG